MNGFQGVQNITNQMVELLDSISASSYTAALDLYDGSTIGKHFRHILDFYNCLANGLQFGTVDYSCRERNPDLEEKPEMAAELFKKILPSLNEKPANQVLTVRSDFSSNSDEGRISYDSTLGRELFFIHDHAVHHLAIIKMGLKIVEPNLNPGKEFGLAPSTIKFQQTNN